MKIECNGYWEECLCDDCREVARLYNDLGYYKGRYGFEEEVEELERKINSMGYSY